MPGLVECERRRIRVLPRAIRRLSRDCKILDNIDKLELLEKVDLLTSVSALVAAGQMPVSEALALVPKFRDVIRT